MIYVEQQDQWNGPFFVFLKTHISAPGDPNSSIFCFNMVSALVTGLGGAVHCSSDWEVSQSRSAAPLLLAAAAYSAAVYSAAAEVNFVVPTSKNGPTAEGSLFRETFCCIRANCGRTYSRLVHHPRRQTLGDAAKCICKIIKFTDQ